MKTSPRGGGIQVFDFNDEEELSESVAGKYISKLRNPNSDDHAVLKYEFLECVAQGTSVQTKQIASVHCVDVDAVDCELTSGNGVSYASLDKAEAKTVSMTECTDDAPQSKSLIHEDCSEFKVDNHESRSFLSEAEKRCSDHEESSPRRSQLNSDHSYSPSSKEPDNVTSDVDESMSRSYPSSPASGMAEDDALLNNYAVDHCSGDMEMDDMNMTVVLYPDYVIYRNSYCTGPQLSFSNSSIKISCSTTSEYQEEFNVEWEIDDLVNIVSQWFQRTQTVMIKVRVISSDTFQDDIAHGTSGVEELKIAVVEPNWSQKQEEIASLNQKYLAVWDLDQENIMGINEDDSPERRNYFPV